MEYQETRKAFPTKSLALLRCVHQPMREKRTKKQIHDQIIEMFETTPSLNQMKGNDRGTQRKSARFFLLGTLWERFPYFLVFPWFLETSF